MKALKSLFEAMMCPIPNWSALSPSFLAVGLPSVVCLFGVVSGGTFLAYAPGAAWLAAWLYLEAWRGPEEIPSGAWAWSRRLRSTFAAMRAPRQSARALRLAVRLLRRGVSRGHLSALGRNGARTVLFIAPAVFALVYLRDVAWFATLAQTASDRFQTLSEGFAKLPYIGVAVSKWQSVVDGVLLSQRLSWQPLSNPLSGAAYGLVLAATLWWLVYFTEKHWQFSTPRSHERSGHAQALASVACPILAVLFLGAALVRGAAWRVTALASRSRPLQSPAPAPRRTARSVPRVALRAPLRLHILTIAPAVFFVIYPMTAVVAVLFLALYSFVMLFMACWPRAIARWTLFRFVRTRAASLASQAPLGAWLWAAAALFGFVLPLLAWILALRDMRAAERIAATTEVPGWISDWTAAAVWQFGPSLPLVTWGALLFLGLIWLIAFVDIAWRLRQRGPSSRDAGSCARPRWLAAPVRVHVAFVAGALVLLLVPLPPSLGYIAFWVGAAMLVGASVSVKATLQGLSFVIAGLCWVYVRIVRLFVTRRAGLTVLALLPLAVLSALLADVAYRNLQTHYQNALYAATTEVDVIAELCERRADIVPPTCSNKEFRDVSVMSDTFVWSMLVSAEIIDPLDVPNPANFGELEDNDPAAWLVVRWLRGELQEAVGTIEPYRRNGVELIIGLSHACSPNASGPSGYQSGVRAIVAAYLADLYRSPEAFYLPDQMLAVFGDRSDALKARLQSLDEEFKDAWRRLPFSAAIEDQWRKARMALRGMKRPDSVEWLAPQDPRSLIRPDKDQVADRAGSWEDGTLGDYVLASENRKSFPRSVQDVDIIAMLLGQVGDVSPYGDDSNCEPIFDGSSLEPPQVFNTFKNFERLATYFAGLVRTSPEVKQARIWLSIFTGYEQPFIIGFFIFGVLAVGARLVVILPPTLLSLVSRRFARLTLFDSKKTKDTRDNDFDGLASSKWPARLTLALLPAAGFIGTVRGIMLSLNGADSIVWAETVNERSTAISALALDLGLAFATTLLALLSVAILTFLVTVEGALSERLVLMKHAHWPRH